MKKYITCYTICVLLFLGFTAYADEFKAAVVDIPDKNNFMNLLKAIGDETGNTFDVKVYPRARALAMVKSKQADLFVPSVEIMDVEKKKKLNYDYSNATIFNIVCVLYTNKDRDMSSKELLDGNLKNYKIEAHISQKDQFNFPTTGSTSAESTFKKLSAGRIDGCIFAQSAGDFMLKKLGLKNIKRKFYYSYNSKFAIGKGSVGSKVDAVLTDGIQKLKTSGKFNKIFGETLKAGSTYADWQL